MFMYLNTLSYLLLEEVCSLLCSALKLIATVLTVFHSLPSSTQLHSTLAQGDPIQLVPSRWPPGMLAVFVKVMLH